MRFKDMFEGIQCDSENKMFYVSNNDGIQAAIEIPAEYEAEYLAFLAIEDPDERQRAGERLEARAESDDSVWEALETASEKGEF